jgi:uncharacterized membrane protein
MRRYAIAYAATLLVFLVVDYGWLTIMANRLYRPLLGNLLAPSPVLWAAGAFYLIYIAGLTGFVVVPSTTMRSALLGGAAFGLVAYATYDLTNQATLRDWPIAITAADLVWGMIVSGVAAVAGNLIMLWFLRRGA